MRKVLVTVLALAGLATASLALAVDYWGGPPPDTWQRGAPGSTYQHWNFAEPDVPVPESWDNPYGTPTADFSEAFEWENTWECPPELDPDGMVDGYHCFSPDGGSILLSIPNTPDPTGVKWIFLQITSSKAPSDVTVIGEGPGGPFTSGTWATGLPHIQWPGPAPFDGVWYTYNYGRYVSPNPERETILISVPECTVVDQIVVDTICTVEPISAETSSWSDVKRLFE